MIKTALLLASVVLAMLSGSALADPITPTDGDVVKFFAVQFPLSTLLLFVVWMYNKEFRNERQAHAAELMARDKQISEQFINRDVLFTTALKAHGEIIRENSACTRELDKSISMILNRNYPTNASPK